MQETFHKEREGDAGFCLSFTCSLFCDEIDLDKLCVLGIWHASFRNLLENKVLFQLFQEEFMRLFAAHLICDENLCVVVGKRMQ